MDLSSKRVVITGSNGFLGGHVWSKLKQRGCKPISILDSIEQSGIIGIRSKDFDLTTARGVKSMYNTTRPDIVIHLAAVVGGIGINQKKPGTFFYKNLMMGTLLIEYGRKHEIDKFVAIGTICAYPKYGEVPMKETRLWDGYPEETNAPYGLAKKMMLVQSQAYREEFGFNSIYLLPVNLYGPNDNFNPETSHVIPALIKKCVDARNNNLDHIDVWGTGEATREFLYVEDAAEGIIAATESYDKQDPVNIGAGFEISIKNLVGMIKDMVGYEGTIKWDTTKPDGQPRRFLDTQRASKEFGFKAKVNLEEGIRRTIDWYEREDRDEN